MAKKMTEVQAWLNLAKRWDRPKVTVGHGAWLAIRDYGIARGLCAAVHGLYVAQKISGRVLGSMEFRMRNHRPVLGGIYWWPTTKRGAKSRAVFCRKMAKLAREDARNDS